jgi:hypothetical protein
MKHRFIVVEYGSGYAVRDRETNKEHWMSDGVDCVFTKLGKSMRPGSEYFRKAWQKSLNASSSETEEAYFS